QVILLLASWRLIFVFYLFYALAITSWLFLRFEETLPPEKRIPFSLPNIYSGLREIIQSKPTVIYTICMGICFGSFIGYLNSSQQILQIQFNTGKMFS